ncbi:hypothetical protein GCM10011335_36760 [Aureimonas glaciei]|uniref:Uncharacterized protein n=1 Tax=Aureimonas glaciei TaxID=1776957 RepID=A0A916Y4B6_9HYPH|nr:hypothetical protein GCM10011335_36760 [Aureimonas glaciei]
MERPEAGVRAFIRVISWSCRAEAAASAVENRRHPNGARSQTVRDRTSHVADASNVRGPLERTGEPFGLLGVRPDA